MRFLRWVLNAVLGLALILMSGASALAQQDLDSTTADAKHHKVEFENDQVRVVRWQIPPGETTARHSHPANVNVFLTDANVLITTDDGKSNTVQAKAGDAAWRGPVTHVAKNLSDKPVEGIIVEPKNPHSARPAGSADETTFPGGRSKVLFENEKVRVCRYRFEPGDKNAMHGHPDNVQIVLTDSNAMVTTADGKTTASKGKAGAVNWRPATQHSVQNVGDKAFEGILVEMKGAATTVSR
jgi:quercetin dioxygenase-like cupin family protein